MEIFQNQDEAYLSWVDGHPEGYVLNLRPTSDGGRSRLHKAMCKHFYRDSSKVNNTAATKVCDTATAPLMQWGEEHAAPVRECSSCKPLDS